MEIKLRSTSYYIVQHGGQKLDDVASCWFRLAGPLKCVLLSTDGDRLVNLRVGLQNL